MREGSGRGKTSSPRPRGSRAFFLCPPVPGSQRPRLGRTELDLDGTSHKPPLSPLRVHLLHCTVPAFVCSFTTPETPGKLKSDLVHSCDPGIWYIDTRCTAAGHVPLSLNIPRHIPTARCSTAASHHTSHSSTSTPGPRSSGQQGVLSA
nr:uncharacterized protein LOC121830204 isoform X1 [Peromyscus maniculatus bairdii]